MEVVKVQAPEEMADYFKSDLAKEKRSEMLNVRIPKSLKARLKQLAEFWTERAKLQTRDAQDVTVGDVVVRLLTVGIEGAWTDAGLSGRPSQAEVDELVRTMKSPS
jgi:hypothetical protein